MFIDSRSAADIRRLLHRASISALGVGANEDAFQLSLPAILDLAFFRFQLCRKADGDHQRLDDLQLPWLPVIFSLLNTRMPFRSENPFERRSLEAFPIRNLEDVQSKEWVLFRARFAQSAGAGKKGDVFHGVSSILAEIGDNVVWHASAPEAERAMGVAAYHVTERIACFSVADDGRGFCASLRSNPKWKHLRTEREALEAVLFDHATSRLTEQSGGGFDVLYNKLLSVNAAVSIRSRGCHATLRCASERNSVIFREGQDFAGTQVTVTVAKAGDPVEIPV
jgi:hypothetical protein